MRSSKGEGFRSQEERDCITVNLQPLPLPGNTLRSNPISPTRSKDQSPCQDYLTHEQKANKHKSETTMAPAKRELFLDKHKEGGYKIKRSEAKVRNEITVIQEKICRFEGSTRASRKEPKIRGEPRSTEDGREHLVRVKQRER